MHIDYYARVVPQVVFFIAHGEEENSHLLDYTGHFDDTSTGEVYSTSEALTLDDPRQVNCIHDQLDKFKCIFNYLMKVVITFV